MSSGLMLYGCYGYSGRLIADQLLRSGTKPLLAGRDESRVREMAHQLQLDYCVFSFTDEQTAIQHLKKCRVLLNCAGPFVYTAHLAVKCCLQTGVHYLDITGEYQVFEDLQLFNRQARNANILIMPGVGFDVVPSDCLALHLKKRLPTANSLELALLQINGGLSQGTALTVLENLGEGCVVRRNGKLEVRTPGSIQRSIHLGDKTRTAVAIAWGDISTAYLSTQISDITVYNFLPKRVIRQMRVAAYFHLLYRLAIVKNYLRKKIKSRPAGPNEHVRKNARTAIWGQVKNDIGAVRTSILHMPEGYTLTSLTASAIAMDLLDGKITATGFNTPAMVFGPDYILQFPEVTRVDVD